MSSIIAFVKRNPARVYALTVAGIGLLAAFGLSMTGVQVAAIEGFVALVLGESTRTLVDPHEPPSKK